MLSSQSLQVGENSGAELHAVVVQLVAESVGPHVGCRLNVPGWDDDMVHVHEVPSSSSIMTNDSVVNLDSSATTAVFSSCSKVHRPRSCGRKDLTATRIAGNSP